MEQKNIQFDKGIHRSPSVEASNGELSELVNLIPKNGELVNVKPPVRVDTIGNQIISFMTKEDVVYIHDLKTSKNFLTVSSNRLFWRNSSDSVLHEMNPQVFTQNLKQIVAIDNTLSLIYDSESKTPICNLLWSNGKYVKLSTLPNLSLDLFLKKDGEVNVAVDNCIGEMTVIPTTYSFSDADKKIASIKWTGAEKTITNDDLRGYGALNYSQQFFRNDSSVTVKITTTFDGESDSVVSTISPGATIRLWLGGITDSYTLKFEAVGATAETQNEISVLVINDSEDVKGQLDNKDSTSFDTLTGFLKSFIRNTSTSKKRFMYPFFARYCFKLYDGTYINISEPFLLMPNSGIVPIVLCSLFNNESAIAVNGTKLNASAYAYVAKLWMRVNLQNYTDWKDIIKGVSIAITSPIYSYNQGEEWDAGSKQGKIRPYSPTHIIGLYGVFDNKINNIIDQIPNGYDASTTTYKMDIPSFSDEEMKNKYLSTSIFRIVKTYTLDQLAELNNQDIELDLSEVDLENLDTYPQLPDGTNTAGVMYPGGAFAYNNRLNIYNINVGFKAPEKAFSPTIAATNVRYKLIVYLHNDGTDCFVSSNWINKAPAKRTWIYYGNNNAFKCVLCKKTTNDEGGYEYSTIETKMSTHPWLVGSYALLDDVTDWVASTEEACNQDDTADFSRMPNAIFQSNAHNPFYFPESGKSEIGTGYINTVSTATKAMSTGQFGQFPLYVFATDGIWAMEVDDQGRYSAPNPVNRDVVTNIDSVCQIDDSLVYASRQGLKQLVGSDTKKLSGVMEGVNVDESVFFSDMADRNKMYAKDTNSIVNMLESCKIIYDNAGARRIHIYPSDCKTTGKHYIYDFDEDAWTSVIDDTSKVKNFITGYPYSIIVNPDMKMRAFTNDEDNNVLRKGVLLTRAMDFDDPLTVKMLEDIRLLYTKNNKTLPATCKVAVFVSNDRVKWSRLKSLKKHSYKWYRFRIRTEMTDNDALTSLTCIVDETRTNKLR